MKRLKPIFVYFCWKEKYVVNKWEKLLRTGLSRIRCKYAPFISLENIVHIKHSDYTLYPKSILHCLFYLHFVILASWVRATPVITLINFAQNRITEIHMDGLITLCKRPSTFKTPTLSKVIRTRSPGTLFHCCSSPSAGSSCGLGSWVAKAIVFIFQIGESVCWSAWNSTDCDDCDGWKEGRNTVNGVPTVLHNRKSRYPHIFGMLSFWALCWFFWCFHEPAVRMPVFSPWLETHLVLLSVALALLIPISRCLCWKAVTLLPQVSAHSQESRQRLWHVWPHSCVKRLVPMSPMFQLHTNRHRSKEN